MLRREDQNPFAIVVLAARTALKGRKIKNKLAHDIFKKDLKIELFKELQLMKTDQRKINAIWNFINFYICFEFETTKDMFDMELNILTKNIKTMGIEEQILEMVREDAMEKGEMKGKKELKEELARKCIIDLDYNDQQAAKFLNVTVKFIKDIRKEILLPIVQSA